MISQVVVGDTVNAASRLQYLIRKYDCRLVISAQLASARERGNESHRRFHR